MTDKPTGVFVRLPLNDGQKQVMDGYACGEITMLQAVTDVGTPVTGEGLEILGSARLIENNGIGWQFITDDQSQHYAGKGQRVETVTPLDAAQAKLAQRDAEIARLRKSLEHIRDLPFPMMDLPAATMHSIAHKALKGPEA